MDTCTWVFLRTESCDFQKIYVKSESILQLNIFTGMYLAEFIFISELSRLHHNMFLVCKGINMIGTLGVTEKSHWVTSHI